MSAMQCSVYVQLKAVKSVKQMVVAAPTMNKQHWRLLSFISHSHSQLETFCVSLRSLWWNGDGCQRLTSQHGKGKEGWQVHTSASTVRRD